MALAVGAMLLLVSACGGSASGDSKGGDKARPGASASQGGKGDTTESQAVVTIAPEDGADEVATTGTSRSPPARAS